MSGGYPFHTQSPRNNFYQERHKQYSPGENGDFIPLRFSSPIHHPRGAGPSNSGRPFHRRSHGGFSSGFNSTGSPYNNNSFTRNTRSFNNRSGGRRSYNRNSNSYPNHEDNSSSHYYHPSMLEDPWAALEEKYKSEDETETENPPPAQSNKSTDNNIINLSDDELNDVEISEEPTSVNISKC